MSGLEGFRRDESGFSPAFFLAGNLWQVGLEQLDALEHLVKSTNKPARICIFESPTSALQTMLIVQAKGMDSRPRMLQTKPKIFIPVRGPLLLIKMHRNGEVSLREILVPGRDLAANVAAGEPYIDLPLDDLTSHLEITLGPHDRVGDRNFPPFEWDTGPESRAVWRDAQVRLALQARENK
jgi:hypothetical protein